MSQTRGQLTDRIQNKALELLGRTISRDELRLMPFILYVMQNEQKIDHRKINADDIFILAEWQKAGFIEAVTEGGRVKMGHIGVTKQFWDIMNEIVFLGYVDID